MISPAIGFFQNSLPVFRLALKRSCTRIWQILTRSTDSTRGLRSGWYRYHHKSFSNGCGTSWNDRALGESDTLRDSEPISARDLTWPGIRPGENAAEPSLQRLAARMLVWWSSLSLSMRT